MSDDVETLRVFRKWTAILSLICSANALKKGYYAESEKILDKGLEIVKRIDKAINSKK